MLISQATMSKKETDTVAGTTTGATATISGESGIKFAAMLVTGWSDAASLLTLKDDTTTLVEWKVEADKPIFIPLSGVVEGSVGNDMSVVLATSTADCSISLTVAKF